MENLNLATANVVTLENTFRKLTNRIYDFNYKGDKDNAYFKDVILSQEMVDNFKRGK
jgi:hypothetical protein